MALLSISLSHGMSKSRKNVCTQMHRRTQKRKREEAAYFDENLIAARPTILITTISIPVGYSTSLNRPLLALSTVSTALR